MAIRTMLRMGETRVLEIAKPVANIDDPIVSGLLRYVFDQTPSASPRSCARIRLGKRGWAGYPWVAQPELSWLYH